MNSKETVLRVRFSKILWTFVAVLLCGALGLRADVTVPANETWDIDGDVDGALWVWGTANVLPGAIVTDGLWVQAGGTAHIYGGSIGWCISVSPHAVGMTVYGTDFTVNGGSVDYGEVTLTEGSATLGGNYEDGSLIDLFIFANTINLQPYHLPVANDDSATTEQDTPVTIDVVDNDTDEDLDELTVLEVTQGTNGLVEINEDGTVTYTPAGGTGTDEFTYTVTDGKGGTDVGTVIVTVTGVGAQEIDIDIKPGSYPNTINLGSNGVVPVAILSTAELDATTLNPENVFLAGSGVRVRGKGNKYLAHEQDVNGDGLMDLVVQVETENLDPGTFQDGSAVLNVHETSDQESPVLYQGSDQITIVPPE